MPTPDPDHYDRDTPDAPPTAGLRCPKCGAEPRLTTERFRPEDCGSPVPVFEATIRCCRNTAGGSAYGERGAAEAAAGRWLRLYPTPVEED